ncbi:MAG: lactate utilization protein LutB domain-containing protein, partial [Pseudomonadota bacterium]
EKLTATPYRFTLGMWAMLAKRPRLYRVLSRAGVRIMELIAGRKGFIRSLPGAGGWTRYRDLPSPQAGTFMDQYRQGRRR